MVLNTNVAAQGAARLLGESSQLLSKSLSRLSSGSKLVAPEDDVAGWAISMRLDAQINRTSATSTGLSNAVSFSQTQDGYLAKIGKALDRMGELAMLAQDGMKTDTDRGLYNQEFQTLRNYINDSVTKDFNGVSLFAGSPLRVTTDSDGGALQMTGVTASYFTNPATSSGPVARPTTATLGEIIPGFTTGDCRIDGPAVPGPVVPSFSASTTLGSFVSSLDTALRSDGAGYASYDTGTGVLSVTVTPTSNLQHAGVSDVLTGLGLYDISNFSGSDMTVTSTLTYTPPATSTPAPADISTASGAVSTLTTIKSALAQLATDRATVGANITRLNGTIEGLGTLKDNLSTANSRIKDVDVSAESGVFARYNILVQAGTAMLAQANAAPQSVLRLLS